MFSRGRKTMRKIWEKSCCFGPCHILWLLLVLYWQKNTGNMSWKHNYALQVLLLCCKSQVICSALSIYGRTKKLSSAPRCHPPVASGWRKDTRDFLKKGLQLCSFFNAICALQEQSFTFLPVLTGGIAQSKASLGCLFSQLLHCRY